MAKELRSEAIGNKKLLQYFQREVLCKVLTEVSGRSRIPDRVPETLKGATTTTTSGSMGKRESGFSLTPPGFSSPSNG